MPAATLAKKAAAKAVARKVAETTGSFALSAASVAARSRTVRWLVLGQVALAVGVALVVPFLILGISTAHPPGAGEEVDEVLAEDAGIPEVARVAYLQAAAQARQLVPGCQVGAGVLAGVYATASNHGHGRLNPQGTAEPPILGPPGETPQTVGPGRFLLTDWLASRADGNGDGQADPQNIYDAALTTAVVACRTEAGGGP